ncbi:recombinase family protein [Pseudophaeobacter leonis]|uniref:recombinase family protein n=1 Tax=Pseudophaeobacter leonis TaxID=1144477 RepID=UPI0013747FD5|nr:recombinase family protein [Pseudophaeobacter leonis]
MSYPFGNALSETESNAIAYGRVSTNRQAEHELSIAEQLQSINRFCETWGINVVHEYKDAHTGREMDGRSIDEIVDLIESGTESINMLIVHSFSRLARDAFALEMLRRKLEKCGVQIISITQPIDDTPTGDLLRQVISAFDEYNSNEIAKHVTRTMRFNAEQGFWNGGIPPFGYCVDEAGKRGKKTKKKLAVDANEAEDVLLIYTLYLDGDG